MYQNIKKEIKKPQNEENIEDSSIPFNVQKVLQMQENTLNQNEIKEKKFQSMYKHLANKSKKKEEELLIKKIDHLRIKKELDEITINKSLSPGNYPHGGTWIMNLRSEKNNLFPATSYLNYGEQLNPYYVPIRERRNKSIDILRDPKSTSKINSKLLIGHKDFLSENKSNLNDKSSLNSSTLNFVQSISTNLQNNQSVLLDDITSINTNISNRNMKKSLADMVVSLLLLNY